MAGEDVEGLAVFGDGATGDFDALAVQEFGEFVVAEGFGFELVFDELGDGVFDAVVAEVLAGFGADAMGEEELEFEDAVRGGDVFAGDGAADGGFVDADGLGDSGHVQGAKVGGAGFEELALVADDFVGDFLDGLLALMDGADEEFAAADFFADVLADVLAAANLAEDVFVGVADAEIGEVVIVHDGDPFFALLFDDDVGVDVGVGRGGEALGGAGVEGADEVGGAGDLLDGDAEAAGHDGVALVGEVFKVLFD